uniref:Uncharacterized protein n=1 Tax=Ciona savignyi TaxID=51511 RepID=H2YQQ8_CIOSA
MATIFAAFGKTVGNNKNSIQNFGIVGVTIATEEIAKFIFFYCPCDYPANKLYGSVFIWGPAFVLLLAGFLVNRRTWRLTTGLCNRSQGIGKGGKRIFHFLFIFFQIFVKAAIAPATWLILAFLKGDYYACARWPNPNDYHERERHQLKASNDSLPRPCMFNPNPIKFDGSEAEIIARNLRAESHTIGWLYVCVGLAIGVVMVLIFRCRSKYSYEQGNYIDRYRQSEISQFEEALDTKAAEQAKRIVDGYFSKPRSKEEWDQIAVINDKVMRSKRGRAIYSPLHKFVNKELRMAEAQDQIDDLVSDAAMKLKGLGFRRKAVQPPKQKNGSEKKVKEKPKQSPAAGSSLPMAAMLLSKGGKTKIVKQQPIELKQDAFKNAADESKQSQPPPVSAVNDAGLVVVDPTVSNPQLAGGALPTQQLAPVDVNPPPGAAATLPYPEPTPVAVQAPPADPQPTDGVGQIEIEAAVKETSLGDFGGAISREDISRISHSSEENISGNYQPLDKEDEQEYAEEDHSQDNGGLGGEDEEPLLGED